jgi:hypothetical protein
MTPMGQAEMDFGELAEIDSQEVHRIPNSHFPGHQMQESKKGIGLR